MRPRREGQTAAERTAVGGRIQPGERERAGIEDDRFGESQKCAGATERDIALQRDGRGGITIAVGVNDGLAQRGLVADMYVTATAPTGPASPIVSTREP